MNVPVSSSAFPARVVCWALFSRSIFLAVLSLLLAAAVNGQTQPPGDRAGVSQQVASAEIRVPEPKAWTGQRVTFFVALRARGSFAGAASFSLPRIPRTVIIKIGNPVVSSQELQGESWFVQTHEFALFSQQTGVLEIPSFEVRFGTRDGFTGPVTDRQVMVPAATVQIERPPGSEDFGFLITTESIDITETWDPQPGAAQVGAVFTRTISQRADQVTGIAFAPPPVTGFEGVRVYVGKPEVADETERGAFAGTRRDTITYVLQEPGTWTLPAVTYVWWNPSAKQLRSKTLPAVTFEVAAPAGISLSENPSTSHATRFWWIVAGLLAAGLCAGQHRRILMQLKRWWRVFNPRERVAARRLLRTCRRHDAFAAQRAWTEWLRLQSPTFEPDHDLRSAVVGMQRHLFGPTIAESWNGNELKQVFRAQRARLRCVFSRTKPITLPPLNPSPESGRAIPTRPSSLRQ